MEKNSAPEISVVMPVYNSGKFLEESIESILNQTFDNFELIIIYDKSPDNSKQIIDQYTKTDDRIILVENEIKLGIAAARNRGLEIARGKYIAVMDSDDVSLPRRLEREYLFLENNPEFFLVGSQGITIDEKGNYLDIIKVEEYPAKVILDYFPFVHSSLMYRNKKIMYRDKFFLADDYDFCLRLVSIGLKLINIDEVLVKYRLSRSSTTRTNLNKLKLYDEKAVEFFNQRLENGKDEYDTFNEKLEVVPIVDSDEYYLKYVIRNLIKNGNIKEAKKYYEEYNKLINFKNKFKYELVLTFPIIYIIRLKIKSFIKSLLNKKL